jgi:hypothetical protein
MHQPLSLVLLKTNQNTFIIEPIETGYNSTNYKLSIDGVIINLHRTNIELKKEPKVIFILTEDRFISHYESSDGEKLDVVDYEMEKKKLLKNSKDSEDGDKEFDSLDCEYAYRKFIQKWRHIQKIMEVKSEVSISVKNIVYSEYSEIIPSRLIDDIPLSIVTCRYTSNYKKWLSEICTELGIVHEDGLLTTERSSINYWSNSKIDLIKYAKINDGYIFREEYGRETYLTDTYEKCIIKRNADYAELKRKITEHFKAIRNKQLSKLERVNLLSSLQSISDTVRDIEVMKKSHSDKSKLQRKISDTINLLKDVE